ncbi:MAG: glycine cleavage T C-terminal barrel domain-containing protein [Euryarchaeota archaeon]
MSDSSPVRTALYACHLEAEAKMVDFHGFELPIWYSSIQEEHLACRSSAGMFDVSHMGFFSFRGDNVRQWLESISTQRVSSFSPGRCGYTHFLDHEGQIIDDMFFAIKSDDCVLGVPNASMVPTMWGWFSELLPDDGSVTVENLSDETSIIALQGPNSGQILTIALGGENSIGRFKCQGIAPNETGITGWIQGTGYTGESGAEIFVPNEQADLLWNLLLESGKDYGLVPVGLGARDTLRLEKGYLLSGQDFLWPGLGIHPDESLPTGFLSRDTAETAVPFGLDMDHDFVGRSRVLSSLDSDVKWHGLRCLDRGPAPRLGHAVKSSDDDKSEIIGYVTSGCPSPSLSRTGIAMAYLNNAEIGAEVWIQASPRRRVRAEVVRPPFV